MMLRVFSLSVALARALLVLTLAIAIPLTVASGAVAHGAAADGKTSPLKAHLQRDLDAYLKERSLKEHLSSLSLTVSLGHGRPPLNVTSGTTRYGAGPLVTPDNLYQIGSNTKAFTAVAILQLEARGKLSIDAPIAAYLPQYPAYGKLTLRQLLRMAGGLESYDNTSSWERSVARNPHADLSPDALIRFVYPHIMFTPGTKYHYSNTGYVLAQEIVAARSDSKSFTKEIARLITNAGLKNTFYAPSAYPEPIARRIVAGYYENNDPGLKGFLGKDVSRYSLSWAQGAGAMVSTPADLAKWARVLYAGTTLLPAKQRQELTSLISTKTAKPLTAPTAGDPAGFGLGVAQRFDPKLGTFWFYQGETLGFRATHLYFPTSDLVVCLFANSRPVEGESHIQSLFAKIYGDIQKAGNAP